jgi:low affinity Fe/Cu permease
MANFSGPATVLRSRLMESSRLQGYANPNTRKFQFHLKQDNSRHERRAKTTRYSFSAGTVPLFRSSSVGLSRLTLVVSSRVPGRADMGCNGPVFGFSKTWQMVINTGTTIVTFLMVFLIQHAQNHDARAMQLKLDELLRALDAARTGLVNLEERSEAELSDLKQEFGALSEVLERLPKDDQSP